MLFYTLLASSTLPSPAFSSTHSTPVQLYLNSTMPYPNKRNHNDTLKARQQQNHQQPQEDQQQQHEEQQENREEEAMVDNPPPLHTEDEEDEDQAPTASSADEGGHSSRNGRFELASEQEDELVQWYQENPLMYDQANPDFKNRQKKDRLVERKASEMNVKPVQILTWFKSMRTIYGKFKKKKSG